MCCEVKHTNYITECQYVYMACTVGEPELLYGFVVVCECG